MIFTLISFCTKKIYLRTAATLCLKQFFTRFYCSFNKKKCILDVPNFREDYMEKKVQATMVIFGASGDLAWRKLVPAMYGLYYQNMLDTSFCVLGVGRKELSDESFREKMKEGIALSAPTVFKDSKKIESFLDNLHYQSLDTKNNAEYAKLSDRLEKLSIQKQCGKNYLFYFATPPIMYAQITAGLKSVGLTEQNEGWRRVIVEKPFGHDLKSALELNSRLLEAFTEEQIYRIDHYLGKETVQNILVTRFANGIFEPLWNRNFIDHVQITACESLGVGSRAGYYEGAGAIRDMVQNHLLQVLATIAMEPPVTSEPIAVRNEILKVFQSLRKIDKKEVTKVAVRGQYTSATINGEVKRSYREEDGVASDSKTDTYVALKCFIDNWRWNGVPFYLRTGKSLPERVTEIVVRFKSTPHSIYSVADESINQLIIRIQPDEGIQLKFGMKVPGAGFKVSPVTMDFHYSSLEHSHIPEAYERLIYDCLSGDATLFQRSVEMEITWRYIQPLLDAWHDDTDIPLWGYPVGTWGPAAANELINKDGRTWHSPCKNLGDSRGSCLL